MSVTLLSETSMTMDRLHILEEKLRESACVGDVETVQLLLHKGVDVNAMHEINGWYVKSQNFSLMIYSTTFIFHFLFTFFRTPLHWASKRGHRDIVRILLANGADISIRTKNKDSALSLCTNPDVRQLLISEADGDGPVEFQTEQRLPIVPHYLKHPPLADRVELHETRRAPIVQEKFSAMERVPPLPDGMSEKIPVF